MIQILKQVKKNEKEIKQLSKENDKAIELSNKEIYKIKWEVYKNKIRVLEEARDKAIGKIEIKQEKERGNYDKQINELYKPIAEVKKIIRLLLVQKEERNLNFEVENRKGEVEEIGLIQADRFINLKVFIAENDKPVNKYSLIAIGKSIFPKENLVNYPYNYGINLNLKEGYATIQSLIKEAKTKEELKLYYEKIKSKILTETLEEHNKLAQEYLEIIANYSLSDFKDFETYKEFRSLDTEQKEKVRVDYLKSINAVEYNYERDSKEGNKEEEFYDSNKEKYNFKIIEIHGERFY